LHPHPCFSFFPLSTPHSPLLTPSERLLRFLTLLDRDVEIVIRAKAKGHASGLVSVLVA